MISTSMLLSIVEIKNVPVADLLRQFFYPALQDQSLHYHLGGAPFYYMYHDLPYFNLEHLLNWLGASCIFATAWLASLLFLIKLSPATIYATIKQGYLNLKPLPVIAAIEKPSHEVSKELKTVEPIESEFMRYVKLRMSSSSSSDPKTATDEIAIHPETVLKTRPTVSKKSTKLIAPYDPPPVIEEAPSPPLLPPLYPIINYPLFLYSLMQEKLINPT